jgi:hypothetical protein
MAFSTETNANVIPPEGNVSTPSLLSRSQLSPVATCRQTVEAFLAPHHRLGADGYEEP